jgi:hypothetical protein
MVFCMRVRACAGWACKVGTSSKGVTSTHQWSLPHVPHTLLSDGVALCVLHGKAPGAH